MGFSGAVDVAIGLLFIFLVFSLVVSGVHEAGSRLLASRSRVLWSSLRELLDDAAAKGDSRPTVGAAPAGTLTDTLYAHPIIRQLEPRRATELFKRSRLNHIPPTDFGRALVDVLVPAGTTATGVDDLRDAILASSLPDPVKRSLLPLAGDATATLDRVRHDIGEWFDSRMAAASRLYRRNTRWIMVVIGVAVVLAFNLDALGATRDLYRDDALRGAVVEQATGVVRSCTEQAAEQGGTGPEGQDVIAACARDEIDEIEEGLRLPVGWTEGRTDIDAWHVLGWVVAALAIAQGAPFWFDLLRRAGRADR